VYPSVDKNSVSHTASSIPHADRISRGFLMGERCAAKFRREPSRRVRLVVGLSVLALAPPALADGTGWFTQTQVDRGRWEYAAKCSSCHGAQLQGTGAPPLKGPEFSAQWGNKSLKDLYAFVHSQMPLGNPDSLKGQEYADLVAYVLSSNGLPAGQEELTPQSTMDRVLVLRGLAPAPGVSAAAATSRAARLNQPLVPTKQPSTSRPSQEELNRADVDTRSWMLYNKGYLARRYSSLQQIDRSNAQKLRVVCLYQLGEVATFTTGPVVYDGILYATTHFGTYAIDSATCRKRWSHQHVATGPETNATNKGVAIAGGRVIRGTQDGHLYALDAKTGELLWDRLVANAMVGEGVGAAPLIWNDLVFVGTSGGDWGIRGRMMAFRVADGSAVWTFEFIPTGNETGADTWQNPESAQHGGGPSWSHYALDVRTPTLFVPVGNVAPDFHPEMRPGANLFTSSLVALDPNTGKLKWWYQLVKNDWHDRDTLAVALYDVGGKRLVATAGKDGVLHGLEANTGKHLFEVPVTRMLNVDAPLTPEGTRVCPGVNGGVEWNGPSHSPRTGLLYVSSVDWCTTFKLGPKPIWEATVPYTGISNGWGTFDPKSEWGGWLNAIDATTGKMKWRWRAPTPMIAGVTATAGDVVFTGDLNGNFLVFDARDGRNLYSFNTGGPIAGGVITWEQDGKQRVAVTPGNSGQGWNLPGSATIIIFGF
jgi:PQQ-dependent dehydrogenase (methanol/ethanol family)